MLALPLLAAAVGWSYRVPLLESAATWLMARQGLEPVRLTIDTVDLHGLHAHDVLLRNGAVRIGEVSVAYDPLDLLRARIGRVELDSVEVALDVGPDGVALGGVPLGGAAAGGGLPFGGWRIDALALPEARISLEGASGPIRAILSTTLVVGEQDIHAGAFSATVSAPWAGTAHSAAITAQDLALRAEADGTMRLAVTAAAVTPLDPPWSAQAIEGDMVLGSEQSSAHLTIGQVLDRGQPMLVAPFSLAADASLAGPLLEVTLGAAFERKPAARLEIKARHDRSSNNGSATIVLGPVLFQPGSLQPNDLFPAIGALVEDVAGTIASDGVVRWRGGSLSLDLKLRLKGLAFATSAAQFRAVNGETNITRLWPPATAPGQILAGTIEAAGLPPAAFRLKGQLTPKPALKLDEAVVDVAGGEIKAMPFTIDPSARRIDTALRVDHVDLSEITKLLNLDGLSGGGELDGEIPLQLENGALAIRGGKLAARAPGLLRYKPEKLPQEISGAGKEVALMLEALTDFHYETLALELEKSAGGEGTIQLHLNGNNPAVLAGRAFVLNIRIESNFDRLAAIALLALSSAQDMLRQAARRTGP